MLATATPVTPPGWEEATGDLVRLVNRSGAALAWLAPRYGANLVGYAVRRPAGWQQVLYAAGPQALAARPTRYGCPVLCPFPGFVTGARYTWQGHGYTLPPNLPGGRGYAHGFAHTHSWRMTQSSVDTVTAELATMTDLTPAAWAGYPFVLRLRLTARLVGQALVLELEATNEGDSAAPVGLGLHPYFDPVALGGTREQLRACLPGQTERVLDDALPTGTTRPTTVGAVPLPPAGQTALVARTDLGARPAAVLRGPAGAGSVTLTLEEGCRELMLYAPAEQPSVALEPLSCALSAISRQAGAPERLAALRPGGQRRLAVTIAIGPGEEED